MFAPLSHFFHRKADPSENERVFIEAVRIRQPREPRSRRSELVLLGGWILIGVKSISVWWLCHAYPEVKVNAWWVIGPTLLFASLCTVLYWRRD